MLPILSLKPADRLRLGRTVAYLVTVGAMGLVLLLARKSWQTNDDIGMAMISGGYGITAAPSSGLVFSNVVWGWLLANLPSVAGIEPYTLLTYASLLASVATLLLAVRKTGAPLLFSHAVVIAMFVPVLATPQFTFTAGYLTVAGLVALVAWRGSQTRTYLWFAGALLLAAGLMRSLEFLLVLAVSAPFLVARWRDMDRLSLCVMATALAILLGAAHLLDVHYYSSADWSAFQGMNRIRTAFTDYRLLSYFLVYPDAVRNGPLGFYDLAMISNWFYADPKIFTPANFTPLLHSVSWGQRIALNLNGHRQWLTLFASVQFLACGAVLLASLLLLRRQIRPALFSIALLLASILLLQMLGRSGMTRVYIPAVASIALLYLMMQRVEERWSLRIIGALALALVTAFALRDVYPRVQRVEIQTAALDKQLCSLPRDPLWVVWGSSSFPYQMLYRPGWQPKPSCAPELYFLGSMQLAPFELDTVKRHTGAPDLVSALLRGREIYLFTDIRRLRLLQGYFAAHYKTALAAEPKVQMPHLSMYAVHTAGPAAAPPPKASTDEEQDDDSGG